MNRRSRMPRSSNTSARPAVIPWEQFQDMFARSHKQGEHVSLCGPTGSGKSTVGLELCKLIGARKARDGRPARVVVVVTKQRDDTVSRLGWPAIKQWPPAWDQPHVIVWPRVKEPSQRASQQAAILSPLLDRIEQEGGQTVYLDECAYFERTPPKGLGLSPTMEQLWSEGRSGKLTLIGGTQRPRHVTLLMWSEPSWVIIFPPEDEEDLKRVAQASGQKAAVLDIAGRLGGHEFLCVRRQRGGARGLYVSKVSKIRR